MEQKRPLIIITGPTASGKTALSIELAKRIGGEIISADSMQVYRHMDIGSAKVTEEEMDGVPHHLIDVLEPSEDFNVVKFQSMAKKAMEEIYSHGHIPIVAGGTGFYIQALLYDIDFTETDESTEIRRELEQTAREKGPRALHELLREVDPESADAIHENNINGLVKRALSVQIVQNFLVPQSLHGNHIPGIAHVSESFYFLHQSCFKHPAYPLVDPAVENWAGQVNYII